MELHVERESGRRDARPALDGPPLGDRVEARVDLDRLEALRVPRQAVAGRQILRIPLLDEPGVGPARGADADAAWHEPNIRKRGSRRLMAARALSMMSPWTSSTASWSLSSRRLAASRSPCGTRRATQSRRSHSPEGRSR